MAGQVQQLAAGRVGVQAGQAGLLAHAQTSSGQVLAHQGSLVAGKGNQGIVDPEDRGPLHRLHRSLTAQAQHSCAGGHHDLEPVGQVGLAVEQRRKRQMVQHAVRNDSQPGATG